MKKISLLILIGMTLIPLTRAWSQIDFGGGVSMVTDETSFGLGLKTIFNLGDELMGSVGGDYYFNNIDVWDINIDVHYKLTDRFEGFYVHPFAGLNIAGGVDENDDTEIGINLGVLSRFNMEKYDLYIEPKYTLGSLGSFVVSIGVFL